MYMYWNMLPLRDDTLAIILFPLTASLDSGEHPVVISLLKSLSVHC